MATRGAASLTGLAVASLLAGALPGGAASVLVVPDAYASIQEAIDAASAGDTVLVRAGVYEEAVVVPDGKDGLVLQGEGMGLTVLDGRGEDGMGVQVAADGVVVRDLTVRRYESSGVYFSGVDGFTVERVAAEDSGVYGIYAIDARHGAVRDSVAWGHTDAGIYVGESPDCACVVERNEAYDNVNGYSGTYSNSITLRGNHFHHNRIGLSLSVLPSEPGVQQHATVVDNWVHDNNNPVPADPLMGVLSIPTGIGIALAGGWSNAVAGNVVEGHELWGIALFWLTTPPMENRVTGNALRGNGVDLWWDEWGVNNCWQDNDFVSSDPAALPDCDPDLPVAGLNNVGIPSPCKTLYLAQLALLQGGQPGAPWQTPLGEVEPPPDVCVV